VSNVQRTVFRLATKLNNAVYRASGGRVMNKARDGIPVLLLTVPGRKSGTPHTSPVGYLDDGGRYVVTGSANGLPTDPQWFKNLRQVDQAHVLVGNREQDVGVVIAEGEERDRLWGQIVARYPGFGHYEKKAQGRTIPVAVLTPR
jgi:deazaflavin-dependent oxidoreductase (nitroreductase family)